MRTYAYVKKIMHNLMVMSYVRGLFDEELFKVRANFLGSSSNEMIRCFGDFFIVTCA